MSKGTQDVFTIPGTESQEALDSLATRFPEASGTSAQVVVVAPAGGTVRDAQVRSRVQGLVRDLRAVDHVGVVFDPYDPDVKGAISRDGAAVIVGVQFDVKEPQLPGTDRAKVLDLAEAAERDGIRAHVGGALFGPVPPGITPLEGLGLVIALAVLLLTFGSALAAGIPLLTALAGAGVSMPVILGAGLFTPISATAPLLALMIGLAVGIDYALFILSRHRDNLAEGLDTDEAAARATATAGSAVVFAGATVALALLALSVARIPFLTTMGIAAAWGVVVAVLVALTLLPALLGFAGSRLAPRSRSAARPAATRPRRTRFSTVWVRAVTRRPIAVCLVVVAALVTLAIPAQDLELALPDNSTAAVDSGQRRAYDLIAEHFAPGQNGPLLVTADIITTTDPVGVVDDIAATLGALPGVELVTIATPNRTGDTGIITVIPSSGPNAPATGALVERIRGLAGDIEREHGVAIAVTGQTAAFIDVSDRLAGALLPFAALVVGLSVLLLMVVFRSIAVPLTAVLGYLLSVGGAFGAVTLVFGWGWGADLLGVQRVGPVISFLPTILMGVLFGLAMDYQVFLVSRMREHFTHHGDAARAVTAGFEQASRVVTAAAVIMVGVFVAFVPHGDTTIKPMAFGLAVGVFLDAFVVRMTFIPAVMTLLGDRAWWLPSALEARLPVLDVEGADLERRLASAHREDAPAVTARGLGLYGARGPVYHGVDLDVPQGAVLVVHGAAGTGKTALLLTLAGRMYAGEGTAEVTGRRLPEEAGAVRAAVALTETAGVNGLEPSLTVEQHIAERIAATRLTPWVTRAAVDRVLDGAAGPRRDAPVADLTPLDRWRLGLALALVGSPRVIVADDVDALRSEADRATAWQALDALAGAGAVTVLAGCHDPAEAVAVVDRGRLHLLDLTAARSAQKVS
jgi:RND superfamily putative drug exporter